jgi:hypothetical protein
MRIKMITKSDFGQKGCNLLILKAPMGKNAGVPQYTILELF